MFNPKPKMTKRKNQQESVDIVLKRSKNTEIVKSDRNVLSVLESNERTSKLNSPTMLLSGHRAPVYGLAFDATGKYIASSSFDRDIFLWQVYGNCANYAVLHGHKNAVLEVHWTYDSSQVVSCSADTTVAVWDAQTGVKVKKFGGHKSVVNGCCPGRSGGLMVVSGSDDGTMKLWDIRVKRAVKSIKFEYPMTCTAMAKDMVTCYGGSLDGEIKVWDIRQDGEFEVLAGHGDIVTGLSLSPDGQYLLSNSMDNTLRKWDVRSFVQGDRMKSIFRGATHNHEKNLLRCAWSPDGRQVTCGSADRNVHIWDTDSTKEQYVLPGHKGSVNQAVFHPNEPIVGSCSSDKQIYLGELVQ